MCDLVFMGLSRKQRGGMIVKTQECSFIVRIGAGKAFWAQRLTSGTDSVECHPRACHQDPQSSLLENESEAGDRLPGHWRMLYVEPLKPRSWSNLSHCTEDIERPHHGQQCHFNM